MKGVRVQNVIHELRGEKIDIIPWNENQALFVKAALQPAEISSIKMDERNKSMEIMVEDDQLWLAIGQARPERSPGRDADRLAARHHLEDQAAKAHTNAIFNLQHIEGVTETMAKGIYNTGFLNVFQVAEGQIESLMKFRASPRRRSASQLKTRAQSVVEKGGEPADARQGRHPDGSASARDQRPSPYDPASRGRRQRRQALANERLRQEMAAAGEGKSPDRF